MCPSYRDSTVLHTCFIISIVNFEHVTAAWMTALKINKYFEYSPNGKLSREIPCTYNTQNVYHYFKRNDSEYITLAIGAYQFYSSVRPGRSFNSGFSKGGTC